MIDVQALSLAVPFLEGIAILVADKRSLVFITTASIMSIIILFLV
jgi:hypothetical protein